MYDFPENPIVQNMERTGYPDGKEPEYPVCPVCGHGTDTIYVRDDGDIVGCDWCIAKKDAWEEPECFPGKEL